jgi:hypothetical protein
VGGEGALVMGYGDAWGNSAQSCVRWAYAMLGSARSVPSILGHLRSVSRARPELTRLELRAQAAQIRRVVETIDDPIAAAYLKAIYLPKPMKERQMGGGVAFVDYFGAERKEAVHTLARWLLAQQGTGVHRIRGYIEIVSEYCLGGSTMRIIARYLKIDNNRAKQVRDDCRTALKDLDKRAHAFADDRLARAGLIT